MAIDDFIFGTLATDELRLRHVRERRGGITHSQRRLPRAPKPGQPISLELTIGPAQPYEQAWVEWSVEGGEVTVTPMEPVGVEWDTLVWGYVRSFRVTLPGQPEGTLLRYRLAAGIPGQVEVYADNGAQYACYIASDSTPEWTRQAIIYQIFVDRFFPGQGKQWKKPAWPSGFYGGTLRGITEKLDYIAKLGANVLWLTPIFPSPSHHGYDATDYFEIEPRLGTKADLCELLEAAHGRGMRVLLDFVPNHWSWLHRTFQQAVSDPDSPYRDWYLFTEWPEKYETFFGVRELPQVNLSYPAAREHMLEAAAYWLKLGVDGYRVDYAAGPAPEFWAYFRRATRLARLDSWSFGEVVEPPDSQVNFEGGLDGCLDFNLLEAFRQAFAFGRWDAQRLASFIARHEAFFPESFSRPSFLDNHDMNRFLWAAGNDKRRLKLAALCQFTLAGAPVIYYGTEVGLSQERDVRQDGRGLPEESRLPMLWGQAQDADLLDYYRSLVSLRKKHPALCRGTCDFLRVDGDSAQNVLAYRRGELLVMLNVSNGEQRLELDMKELKGEVLLQTNGSVPITNGDTLVVRLPPLSGVVIR